MKRRRVATLCCALSLGCTPQFGLRQDEPPLPLQWPDEPAAPKVSYSRSLTGIARDTGVGTLLRRVVLGEDAREESFVLPVAVAVGPDGRVAVADLGRRCVHVYSPEARTYGCAGAGGPVALASPVGVAFGPDSTLYVSDSSGQVVAFDRGLAPMFVLREAGAAKLRRPTGIAFGARARLLYVVDTLEARVHAFHPDGTYAFSFGGRGAGPGELNYPTHLAAAASGELVVADSLNFRIQIFDARGRLRSSFGRHGDGSGDLAMPKGVAMDGAGVVYVADALLDNVQLFDREGEFLLTVGRRGAGFGELWLPAGIFVSDRGELWVCDSYNRRVQVFRLPGAR